jgi:hypothetical protein
MLNKQIHGKISNACNHFSFNPSLALKLIVKKTTKLFNECTIRQGTEKYTFTYAWFFSELKSYTRIYKVDYFCVHDKFTN